MTYFTWKEEGLTKDCESLDSMAARFEESARVMRKMSADAFIVEKMQQKTRSGKKMRRLLLDVAEGRQLGDTTTLADASVVDEIRDRAEQAPQED